MIRTAFLLITLALAGLAIGQGVPCSTFVHGTFEEGTHTRQEVLSGKPEGIRIVRRGGHHTEVDRATRVKVRYAVAWPDECSFKLHDRSVRRGKPVRVWAPTDTITVRITDTLLEGFAYRCTFSWTDSVATGSMKMIVPQGMGIGFGL